MSEIALQTEVTRALRALAIRGEPMNKTVSVKMVVMIDREGLKNMPKGMGRSEQLKWMAASLRTSLKASRHRGAVRSRSVRSLLENSRAESGEVSD
ncbi:hypothetical protein [Caballeronia grimmiae]|uniref:hypothetical protein n=1 Tax=Caballeronia grimmiae TaxID=1071679 RepID=UPI001267E96B|nr:hypothetical protein [Caballeronia grimmiae]